MERTQYLKKTLKGKIKKFLPLYIGVAMNATITILYDKVTELKDERAFEECYRQYFVRLYRFCFSIVHQKQPAEDIVHDVFMQLWKRRSEYSSIRNLEVYLYVSVKNLSL